MGKRGAPTKREASQKTIETRQRIRAVATQLFAECGYHATGVAELSTAVGLGVGALYYHIGSKEELLLDICRSHIDDIVAVGEDLLRQDMLAAEKIRRLARRHMFNVAERTLELRVVMREIDSLTGTPRAEMQQLRDRTEEIWQEIVQQGKKSGEFENLDPLFVKLILGALNYAVLWYRSNGELSPDEIADRTVDLMLGIRKKAQV
ncbi:TetR/AcrR family transcriptional regulator [Nocardia salmonicida]|uniref:TetR/AcrR family transcriptional regulator n=1 Tax=Nocardia salmonicida TaxID=53431 RepID=UPI002E28692B|nr:TetR/AcrR family transcriptional regulator [Nocardia salmonicida]